MGPPFRRQHKGRRSFYGFKIHAAVCVRTVLPLAWQIETAKRNESLYLASLLDVLHARRFRPETVVADQGYDNTRVHAECAERGCEPIIPLKGVKGKQPTLPVGAIGSRLIPLTPRHTERFRNLYRQRSAVERTFGRLKDHHGLATLRCRGLERVRLHADLTILGRLAQALSRTRVAPVAAVA